ncbi:hypothetical protein NX774_09175 [Massilia agilis]|uniref:Uncharacterized protein n=1 Tax=Massilia agilis TaxID=1811226 RepID=A0ABT2D9X2_9BURK|nr:hypothetical protein [Massilia agilis]MCS0808089.1 hypothetical protein [Massilia agilis]
MDKILHNYNMFIQLLRLPVAHLQFRQQIDPENIRSVYRYYTKPHPRYKIIRHKTMGAALVDLGQCSTREQYLDAIKGKNNGAWHAKRARSRGYRFGEIDRNRYVDDIHAINTSLEQRQGRPMDAQYREKKQAYENLPHFRYYGILDEHDRLVAYANLGLFGNFAGFSHLIGIRNNDGIMHLLVVEIVAQMIEQRAVRYVMYDTFFGAQPGMQTFKKILGFRPYRAKYSLQ